MECQPVRADSAAGGIWLQRFCEVLDDDGGTGRRSRTLVVALRPRIRSGQSCFTWVGGAILFVLAANGRSAVARMEQPPTCAQCWQQQQGPREHQDNGKASHWITRPRGFGAKLTVTVCGEPIYTPGDGSKFRARCKFKLRLAVDDGSQVRMRAIGSLLRRLANREGVGYSDAWQELTGAPVAQLDRASDF